MANVTSGRVDAHATCERESEHVGSGRCAGIRFRLPGARDRLLMA